MKPGLFEVRANASNADTIRANAKAYIDAQEGDTQIIVEPLEENRRSRQNRLCWLWNGQIGQSMGVSPDYAHGMCKLDVGLPMWLADEKQHKRAAFVQEVLSHVPERKHKLAVAFDMLRSSDLTVKEFAAYLNAVDVYFAAQGIVLVSPDELRVAALDDRAQSKAA